MKNKKFFLFFIIIIFNKDLINHSNPGPCCKALTQREKDAVRRGDIADLEDIESNDPEGTHKQGWWCELHKNIFEYAKECDQARILEWLLTKNHSMFVSKHEIIKIINSIKPS